MGEYYYYYYYLFIYSFIFCRKQYRAGIVMDVWTFLSLSPRCWEFWPETFLNFGGTEWWTWYINKRHFAHYILKVAYSSWSNNKGDHYHSLPWRWLIKYFEEYASKSVSKNSDAPLFKPLPVVWILDERVRVVFDVRDFKIQSRDGNENVKKKCCSRQNNFSGSSHFLAHFFAVFFLLRREIASFYVLWRK